MEVCKRSLDQRPSRVNPTELLLTIVDQPRTFEVFESLGIVDEVLKRAIKAPNICVFKMPEGVEIVKEFNMENYVEPTPPTPYVSVVNVEPAIDL